ncbi:MAG: penicillin-binding protein 1C, partial [Hyphomicrobiaceae bacterium]
FAEITKHPQPLPPPPRGVQLLRNAELPLPLQRFNGGADTAQAPAVVIAFPPDKSTLEAIVAKSATAPPDDIILKAEGGQLPLTWLVDGHPLTADGSEDGRQAIWQPKGLGFAHISVVDALGRADRVTVRLKPLD